MSDFCVVENGLLEQHAGSKARCDVAEILIKEGWKPVYVHPIKVRNNVSYLERLKVIPGFLKDWRRICAKVKEGDSLLIQYPLDMYPKVAMFALRYIRKMKRKGIKIKLLIHDIDSLRTADTNAKAWYENSEKQFFKMADGIIAHNQKMISYLRNTGLEQPIYSLELFDYLVDGEIKREEVQPDTVVIAGNLSREKAGYLYRLPEDQTHYNLYGPNLEIKETGENISYEGSFQPDRLPDVLKGKFGLVWDGAEIDGCGGVFGEYMRYNNPHKTSLYLACGMPVIVWEKAAVADFVKKEGVGFCVASLSDINVCMHDMSQIEYIRMSESAKKMGGKLRKGNMLKKVIEEMGE